MDRRKAQRLSDVSVLIFQVFCNILVYVPSQDQLQLKIVCPGVVTCLTASPNGLFLATGVAESIYLWEVSKF